MNGDLPRLDLVIVLKNIVQSNKSSFNYALEDNSFTFGVHCRWKIDSLSNEIKKKMENLTRQYSTKIKIKMKIRDSETHQCYLTLGNSYSATKFSMHVIK